jgi:hypothetical protein
MCCWCCGLLVAQSALAAEVGSDGAVHNDGRLGSQSLAVIANLRRGERRVSYGEIWRGGTGEGERGEERRVRKGLERRGEEGQERDETTEISTLFPVPRCHSHPEGRRVES